MGTFHASRHYTDWHGTVTADSAEHESAIEKLVRKKTVLDEDEFIVGLDISLGENHGLKTLKTHVSALIFRKLDDYDTVKMALEVSIDPIKVRKVDLELTPAELGNLFKRLNMVLVPSGSELQGREYSLE